MSRVTCPSFQVIDKRDLEIAKLKVRVAEIEMEVLELKRAGLFVDRRNVRSYPLTDRQKETLTVPIHQWNRFFGLTS